MQITVFENDGRFPVQFERGGLSQMYRFRKGEGLANFGQLREYIDEEFRTAVLEQFAGMEAIRSRVSQRIEPPGDELDELPTII